MSKYNSTVVKLYSIPYSIEQGVHMLFDNKQEQDAFFSNKIKYTFDEMSYQRDVGSIKIEIALEDIRGNVNYLSYQNKDGKMMYCWLLDMQYLNPSTTLIMYSIDPMQTYAFDYDIPVKTYVDRRHFHATKDGIDKIMHLPDDNLELGTTYTQTETIPLTSSTIDHWYLITMTDAFKVGSVNLESKYQINKTDYPHVEVFGNRRKVTNIEIENEIYAMCNSFICNQQAMKYFVLNEIFTNVDNNGKVSQIALIDITDLNIKSTADNIFRYFDDDKPDHRLYRIHDMKNDAITRTVANPFKTLNDYINRVWKNDLNYTSDTIKYPDTPANAIGLYMLKYPYSFHETNDHVFNVRIWKHEQMFNGVHSLSKWNTGYLEFTFRYSCVNTFEVRYVLDNYGEVIFGDTTGDFSILSDNYSKIQAYATMPVVSDYASAYMQANANQISQQQIYIDSIYTVGLANASALQQAGQVSANNAYSASNVLNKAQKQQTQNSIDTSFFNSQNQNALSQQQNVYGLGSIQQGAADLFGNGWLGGTIGGNVNKSNEMLQLQMRADELNRNTAIANNNIGYTASQSAMNLNYQSQVYANNTQFANSKRSLANDRQQAHAMLNARINDIKNVPNSMVNAGNGSPFNYLNALKSITISSKVIRPEPMRRIMNYLSMYGMRCGDLEDIKEVISKFDVGLYIKTNGISVVGNIPVDDLKAINLTYDSGVTLIRNEEDLFDYEKLGGQ